MQQSPHPAQCPKSSRPHRAVGFFTLIAARLDGAMKGALCFKIINEKGPLSEDAFLMKYRFYYNKKKTPECVAALFLPSKAKEN